MKHFRLSFLMAVPLLAVLLLTPAWGTPINLTDQNSIANIDPTSQAGMYNWIVDGVNQLYQQWFWYRIGDNPEQSIDTLTYDGATPVGTNQVTLNYSGVGFKINVLYVLTGGTMRTSDMTEVIRIQNTGTSALDFHFFQYSDFDLNGQTGGQTARLLNANTVAQTGGGMLLSETVATPPPARYEMNIYANTLGKLNDGVATNLNNVAAAGPGDATWAFQWDFTIGGGRTQIISKDKMISDVPEPFTLALVGGGLLVLGWFRRRT